MEGKRRLVRYNGRLTKHTQKSLLIAALLKNTFPTAVTLKDVLRAWLGSSEIEDKLTPALQKMLHNPGSAREALVLQDIWDEFGGVCEKEGKIGRWLLVFSFFFWHKLVYVYPLGLILSTGCPDTCRVKAYSIYWEQRGCKSLPACPN